MATFTITPSKSPEDLASAVVLFTEYAKSLNIDLTFQDFSSELSSMPGKYSPPSGALFLARNVADEAIGCVGLRPLQQAGICEMKRLYVAPAGRGTGVGKALATTVISEARKLGYSAMRLDTLPSMHSALALYQSLGFRGIEAYYETPLKGTVFLELRLDS